MEQEQRTANFKTVSVDDEDVKLLKGLAKELNKQVRLLWKPAPTRQNPAAKPTEVSIVAEEMCFVDYTLFELARDRGTRTSETFRKGEASTGHPPVTF